MFLRLCIPLVVILVSSSLCQEKDDLDRLIDGIFAPEYNGNSKNNNNNNNKGNGEVEAPPKLPNIQPGSDGGDSDKNELERLIDNVFPAGNKSNNNNNNNKNNGNGEVQTLPKLPDLQPGGGGGGIPGTGSCNCVPFYLCNNGSVNSNGEGLIDIRVSDGPCPNYFDTCCNKEDEVEKPVIPTPSPRKKSGCGYHNPDGVGFRITGDDDNEAQFGEFPWMVAILREETVEGNPQKLNVYQCGGALIHPQAVITAAHCVIDKNKKFKIRAGEWDTQTKKEIFPHQDRQVSEVVTHPQYYAGALYNDVAVLFLDSPVEIAENVDVVCLPPQDTVIDKARCFASGWGKDVYGKEGKYQVILKKIDLPIVQRSTCQDLLRKTRLGKFFQLHESFICAGGEAGKDTCKGDGGSPLVCPIPGQTDRYQQAGIVAWGISCGEENVPAAYANVAKFRNWIDEQLSYKNFDATYYKY